MPSSSHGTATQRLADGPVESLSADLHGGYTVPMCPSHHLAGG